MSLTDLASIGTLVSGVAVVISLIYLGLQIRQNTRHQRASMQQGRSARMVDIMLRSAEPDMVQTILRGRAGDPDMSPLELETFLRATTAFFLSFEDGFVLRRSGMLDDTTIAGDDAALKNHILPWPGYRTAWDMLKSGMQPDFRDYVDSLAVQTPIRSASDRLAIWKKRLSEMTPPPSR
jgi:hypothetical protein